MVFMRWLPIKMIIFIEAIEKHIEARARELLSLPRMINSKE